MCHQNNKQNSWAMFAMFASLLNGAEVVSLVIDICLLGVSPNHIIGYRCLLEEDPFLLNTCWF